MENNSDMTPQDKHKNSIKRMINSYRHQQQTIKKSLQDMDRPNSRIIFDDPTINQITHGDKRKKLQLLDTDDENEDDTYRFQQNEFDCATNLELQALQLNYKGDKRFNFDSRFNETNVDDKQANLAEWDIEEEKEHEKRILDKVINSKVLSRSVVKEDFQKKKMLRYDPTQFDHAKYQLQADDNKNTFCKKESVEEIVVPTVSKSTFFKVNSQLPENLETTRPFSLLNAYGNNDTTNTQSTDEIAEKLSITTSNNNVQDNGKNPFKYDSSDDENIEDCNLIGQDDNIHLTKDVAFVYEPFFFRKDDYRFQDGRDFVMRIGADQNQEFTSQRQSIKTIVRAKLRNNLKKTNPFRKKLGGNKRKKINRIKKAFNR